MPTQAAVVPAAEAVSVSADSVTSSTPEEAKAALAPARLAVVVIAYNRPWYLDRALASIFKNHPGEGAFPVYVSQDGENTGVAEVIKKHGAKQLVHPRKVLKLQPKTYLARHPGYAYLSVHYGWALRTLFKQTLTEGGPRYEGIVILEEDIEVAPDFFSYFAAAAPLLYQDPSLLCVSAFNDNGQSRYASNATSLHRSDFFPGLGWLLSRRLWGELEAKWPEERGFWDDWLREPAQRRGRASLRPELTRTATFGKEGTSTGQFFSKYLGKIQLNTARVEWSRLDLSYLLKQPYDTWHAQQLAAARTVALSEVTSASFSPSGAVKPVKVMYDSPDKLKAYCKTLGLMEDLKAGVPRTAYRGVMPMRVHGQLVFLAPSYHVEQDITQRAD